MIVESHNEWDPIEEIIVGTALHSYAPALIWAFRRQFRQMVLMRRHFPENIPTK